MTQTVIGLVFGAFALTSGVASPIWGKIVSLGALGLSMEASSWAVSLIREVDSFQDLFQFSLMTYLK